MYKCPLYKYDVLRKRITTIGRKLVKNGLSYSFKEISRDVEEVGVYTQFSDGTELKLGVRPIEVVSYKFEMEELKVGDYTPVAVIEHGTDTNGNQRNLVYPIGDYFPFDSWFTMKPACAHCNTDRPRKKTVMLLNKDGCHLQVGTTCIKDFTGIDASDIIHLYASVGDIFITEPKMYDFESYTQTHVDTQNYLACCIKQIEKAGYVKRGDYNSTADEAWRFALSDPAETKYQNLALTIIDYYTNVEDKYLDGFGQNIKTAVTAPYTRCSGILAYAPIAHKKLIEYIAKVQELEEERVVSQYQGTIGQKLEVELTLDRKYGYTTDYGYMTIYLFKDSAGNIYKWNTSTSLDVEAGKIRGTVKAHDEYNGEKQTVLTRCKVIGGK